MGQYHDNQHDGENSHEVYSGVKEGLGQIGLEKLSLEIEEATLVVSAFVDLNGKPQAVLKSINNTYCRIERPKGASPFEVGTVLKLKKEDMNRRTWLNEEKYAKYFEYWQARIDFAEKKTQGSQKKKSKRSEQNPTHRKEKKNSIQHISSEHASDERGLLEVNEGEGEEGLTGLRVKRTNWTEYLKILQQNDITSLYHFTDIANLRSIKKNGGLFSWDYCLRKGIQITASGGGALSRELDSRYHLQDYVRLCFTRSHPMMYLAQNEGRISNPVILIVSLEVCSWENTKFANMNATRNGHNCGPSISDLEAIHFQTVKQPKHFDLPEHEKPYYQAEVLVKTHIPLEFIVNINQF